jgi:hypothetical protein
MATRITKRPALLFRGGSTPAVGRLIGVFATPAVDIGALDVL